VGLGENKNSAMTVVVAKDFHYFYHTTILPDPT